jgi:hypothetical protein
MIYSSDDGPQALYFTDTSAQDLEAALQLIPTFQVSLLTCLLKIEKNKTDDCKIFTLFNVLQVI